MGGKWSAVNLDFRSKTRRQRKAAAAALSLFNAQLSPDASRLKHRVETKKGPMMIVIIKLHIL